MTKEEEQRIFHWANRQWPERSLSSRLRKLGEEVGEVCEAVAQYSVAPNDRDRRASVLEECADVANVLVDICWLLRGSLTEAQRAKFAILLEREKKATKRAKARA